MRRNIALAALVLAAASCGEPAEVAPPAAPAPTTTTIAPTTTTTSTTTTSSTTAPPTTPTTTTTTATIDAGELYEEIVAATGWSIPAVAEPDFVADLCSGTGWAESDLHRFAENLLLDDYLAWGAEPSDENLLTAARLAWALGKSSCPERFRGDEPPIAAPQPECGIAGWLPQQLPWTLVVTPPDETSVAAGVTRMQWAGTDGARYEVAVGRDDGFEDRYAAGVPAGMVEGVAARVHHTGDAVEVLWQRTARFCDAWSVLVAPVPEAADLAAYVDELTVWRPSLNAAEQRMQDALDRLSGYGDIGGEPSHGGLDAVYAVETAAGDEIWLYAAVSEWLTDDPFPAGQSRGSLAVAGVTVALAEEGNGWHRAVFEHDGFLVSAGAEELATLVRFVEDWVPAWLG